MQNKPIFLVSLWLLSIYGIKAQNAWVLPLTADYTAQNDKAFLIFASNNKTSALYFDATGNRIELPNSVRRSLGYGQFLVQIDTLYGIFEAGIGMIIPAVHERIENYGPNFFEATNYSYSAILSRNDKVLLDYSTRPAMPYLIGTDTLLIKYGVHPDAKAFGYTKSGKEIPETVATPLYPKDQALRRASMAYKEPKTGVLPQIFLENGKKGLRSSETQVILPAEYDEIRYGLPGYVAIRQNKTWGLYRY
ncbi:MAG: hypothetical protein KGS48_13885 [Bacteroidetes bacterium]|nr:hypothetical protein [Bacteroidota bacterium]